MLKILDMPRGGGADRGRAVWFSLTTESGEEHAFKIDHGQMEMFLKGLRHFSDQAKSLREANGEAEAEAPAPVPVAEKVRSRMTPAGDLEVAVGVRHQEVLQFTVPRAGVKAMLSELVSSFNKSVGAASQTATRTSRG